MFYDCPKLGKSCDNLIVNGVLVRNLCPSTCGTCPHGGTEFNNLFHFICFFFFLISFQYFLVAESLNCQNGASLCQNKAVCRNRSKMSSSSSSKSLIAFECVCSVGFSGDFCEKSSLINFILREFIYPNILKLCRKPMSSESVQKRR